MKTLYYTAIISVEHGADHAPAKLISIRRQGPVRRMFRRLRERLLTRRVPLTADIPLMAAPLVVDYNTATRLLHGPNPLMPPMHDLQIVTCHADRMRVRSRAAAVGGLD